MPNLICRSFVVIILCATAAWTQYDPEPEEKPWTDREISKIDSEISKLEHGLGAESPSEAAQAAKIKLRLAKARKQDLQDLKAAIKIAKAQQPSIRSADLVVRAAGKVEAGASDHWAPAKTGTPLKAGDWLKTGGDGSALVWYDDGFIFLDKNTSMSFYADACLNLKSGFCHWETIRKSSHKQDACDLSTPDTVITAKGTEFDVGYEPKGGGKTRYVPYSGAVELKSNRKPEPLSAEKPAPFPADAAARVVSVRGTATIEQQGSKTSVQTKKGSVVQPGQIIKTGRGAAVELELRDGYRVALRSNSSFEPRAEKEEGAPVYQLWAGLARIWNAAAGSQAPRIRTPTAVAAVRGTDFELEVSPATQLSTVYPKEGILEVSGLNQDTPPPGSIWWAPK